MILIGLRHEINHDYGTRAQEKLSFVIFGPAELDHLEEAIAAQIKGPLPLEGLERVRSVYERGALRL